MNTKAIYQAIPDPEGMNSQRAEWADRSLVYFSEMTSQDMAGDPEEIILSDLLSNFMHYCDRHGIDFFDRVRVARGCYDEETEGKGPQLANGAVWLGAYDPDKPASVVEQLGRGNY